MNHDKDTYKFFGKPSKELVDYMVCSDNEILAKIYAAPCFMSICRIGRYDPDFKTIKCNPTHIYIGLRLPSKYAMGMDLEDDNNREQKSNSYLWKFEKADGKHGNKKDDVGAILYWKYVFGKFSPWRKALSNHEFLYNNEGDPIAVCVYLSKDTDSQILVSGLMAARMPWENLGHLRVWVQAVKDGFKKSEAMYLTAHIRFLRDEKTLGFRTVAGHFPFGPFDTDIVYEWLKKGTPRTDGLKYPQHYDSVAKIWDRAGRKLYKTYSPSAKDWNISKTPLFKILASDMEYKGSFDKMFTIHNPDGVHKNQGIGTWDEVLPKLKATRKEWACVSS